MLQTLCIITFSDGLGMTIEEPMPNSRGVKIISYPKRNLQLS